MQSKKESYELLEEARLLLHTALDELIDFSIKKATAHLNQAGRKLNEAKEKLDTKE